ncbi:MAG TPA: TrkH family potassium uptake protein, partial [Candidatus Hydrogenedentes bacterium]|nr:TrkH family potassium uptake protein [Candidatus Hydrogenedentota bacterium]
ELHMLVVFLMSLVAALFLGGLLYLAGIKADGHLYHRETLALVGVGWLLTAFYGALPYLLSCHMSFVDAYFESMSGFTTTGATVLAHVEVLPKSLLFWRSFTHWLGGLGIILLLIVVLPFLGAGGKLLYRSEIPGLDKSSLRPRIKDSAIILLKIYLILTVAQTILLLVAGMNVFDALCHTFGSLATGGFSTHTKSIAAFNSPLIEAIITIFMMIAGTSFSLLFCLGKGDYKKVLGNVEFRFYVFIIAVSSLLIFINLHTADGPLPNLIGASAEPPPDIWDHMRASIFQTVSVMTTTGFATVDFNMWPEFSRALLVILMFIGGCSGSTGGGIKVVRIFLLFNLAYKHFIHTFNPKNIHIVRVDNLVLPKEHVNALLTYFAIYVLSVAASTLYLAWLNMPLVTSFTAVAACLNNVGPGLELVGATGHYGLVPASGKLLLSFLMAMGRLELYAICVLFIPSFWKRY